MRVFTDPFDRLLDALQETARPQREWVDGRGLLLIAGHFLSGVGAGGWAFSSALGFLPGELTSLVVVGLSGLAHLLFLGHPERFWRMVRVRTSWVGRGFLGLNVLLASAIAYLALTLAAGAADTRRGGVALLLLFLPWRGAGVDQRLLELLELWIGLSAGVCILFYLTIMASASVGAPRSVEDLLRGRVAAAFYGGVVVFGLLIPLLVGLWNVVTPVSMGLLAVVGAASLVGDFYVKYAIAKAGGYPPHDMAG